MNKQRQHDLNVFISRKGAGNLTTTPEGRELLSEYRLEDASPAQLTFLALNGSYGEKLVATLLLESIAQRGIQAEQSKPAFPKGRWTA